MGEEEQGHSDDPSWLAGWATVPLPGGQRWQFRTAHLTNEMIQAMRAAYGNPAEAGWVSSVMFSVIAPHEKAALLMEFVNRKLERAREIQERLEAATQASTSQPVPLAPPVQPAPESTNSRKQYQDDDQLDAAEAAKYRGVSSKTIYRAMKKGWLPFTGGEHSKRVRFADLRDYKPPTRPQKRNT